MQLQVNCGKFTGRERRGDSPSGAEGISQSAEREQEGGQRLVFRRPFVEFTRIPMRRRTLDRIVVAQELVGLLASIFSVDLKASPNPSDLMESLTRAMAVRKSFVLSRSQRFKKRAA